MSDSIYASYRRPLLRTAFKELNLAQNCGDRGIEVLYQRAEQWDEENSPDTVEARILVIRKREAKKPATGEENKTSSRRMTQSNNKSAPEDYEVSTPANM
jgi:hypothetical protein